MSIQAADDYSRNALANAKEENYALVWAVLALVEVAQSIDTRLAEYAELFRPATVPDNIARPFPEPDWGGEHGQRSNP